MTVSNDDFTVTVLGDGFTTSWQYSFIVPRTSDAILTYQDATGTLIQIPQSDYTVTGAGNPAGGTFAYTLGGVAIPSGTALAFERAVPYEQDTSLNNQSARYPKTLEKGLDWLEYQIQQLWGLSRRALRVSIMEGVIPPLPSPAQRAGKILGFADDATALPVVLSPGSIFPGSANIVDTIAVLRGLAVPASGAVAKVLGYYNAQGSGGGWFQYSAAASGADNGGSIIKPTSINPANPGRWLRTAEGQEDIRVWGAHADGVTDDTACFVAARASGLTQIRVPPGSYIVPNWSMPAATHIINNGRIIGNITADGQPVLETGSVVVNNGVPGNFATYPAGSTTFFGNFSTFTPGQLVVVDLTFGLSIPNPTINQNGVSLGYVTVADGTHLVLDRGTHFAYDVPNISHTVGAQYIGALIGWSAGTGGTRFIPGDYTAFFAAGQVIRIENTTGTDSVTGVTAYFENNRIKFLDASGIIVENAMANSYTNPFLVKTNLVEDIDISGNGYIDNLSFTAAGTIKVFGQSCRISGHGWLESAIFSNMLVDNQGTFQRPLGISLSRNVIITNCITKNAFGVTDNAGFKNLGCWDCSFSDILSFGTSTTNPPGAQTVYPFFTDYFFTPYAGYTSGCTYSNFVADVSYSGNPRSIWFDGCRGCTVNNMKGVDTFFFERSVDCKVNGLAIGRFIQVGNCVGVDIANFECQYAELIGYQHATFGPGRIRGANGAHLNNCLLVAAGTLLANSDGAILSGIDIESTTPGDTSIFIQRADGVRIMGCTDRKGTPGTTISIGLGLGVTDLQVLADNVLQNTKQTPADAYSPTITGSTSAGAVTIGTPFSVSKQWLGREMYVGVTVVWTAGTGTGNLRVSLPYLSQNTPSYVGMIPCTPSANGTPWAIAGDSWFISVGPGALFGTVFSMTKATGAIAPVPYNATGRLDISGIYQLD